MTKNNSPKTSNKLITITVTLLCLLMLSSIVTVAEAAKKPPAVPSISVEKYVWNGSAYVEADTAPGPTLTSGPVQFKIIVTNNGNVALNKVKLTDTDFSSTETQIGKLSPSATYQATFTKELTSGQHTTATSTVTGVYQGKTYTSTDTAYYQGAAPGIHISQKANLKLAQIGETVTYTSTVTNSGNVPLTNVGVSNNPMGTATYQSGDTNSDNKLDTSESWIFTISKTAEISPDPFTNIATATGYYETTPYTDSASYTLDITTHGPTPIDTLAPPILATIPEESEYSEFGYSVAIGSGIIAVGALDDFDWTNEPYDIGHVYVYNAETRELITTLNSPNYEDDGEFGYTIVINGDILIVGAPFEDAGGEPGSEYGTVYVYSISDLNAAPLQLNSPTPAYYGEFGITLATDGTYVFVGAEAETVDGQNDAGVVHIFDLSDGSHVHTYNQPTPESFASFGSQISIDSNKLYVSAPSAGGKSGFNEGEVYVFDLETTQLLTTIYSPMPRLMGEFGNALTVTENYIIVGADREDDWTVGGPSQGGLVHIFDKTTYQEITMLKSPNEMIYGYFGEEIATDGTYLIIGASGEGTPVKSGKAYVYALSDLSATPTILTSPNPQYDGYFGGYNCIDINSGTVIVSAPYEGDLEYGDVGHAYIFSLS